MNKASEFRKGLYNGIAIALGYLAVSFSIGIMAVRSGLSVWLSVVMSALNLTSAGQVSGIQVICAGGSILEIILTQLVINARYSLMSLSLTQHLSNDFGIGHRCLAGFGMTDEIFAVSAARPSPVTPFFMYGMISVSAFGWVLGTFLGAFAGQILPDILKNTLTIAIYGMFIAIVVPPARHSRGILVTALLAAFLSCLIRYCPLFSFISEGFSVIICAVVVCTVVSLLFPLPDEEVNA